MTQVVSNIPHELQNFDTIWTPELELFLVVGGLGSMAADAGLIMMMEDDRLLMHYDEFCED